MIDFDPKKTEGKTLQQISREIPGMAIVIAELIVSLPKSLQMQILLSLISARIIQDYDTIEKRFKAINEMAEAIRKSIFLEFENVKCVSCGRKITVIKENKDLVNLCPLCSGDL